MKTNESYINIAISSDDKFVLASRVMLKSLSKYCKNVNLYFIYFSIRDENLRKLEQDVESYHWNFFARKIDGKIDALLENAPGISRYSKNTYYRLFLPWLMPECDKVLYLDVDMMIRSDLQELYQKDGGDSYLIAVPDMAAEIRQYAKKRLDLGDSNYVNTGMQVLFLDKIRRDFTAEEILSQTQEILEKYKIIYPDQDVINVIYQGRITPTDKCWNYGATNSIAYKLTHYSEVKNAKIAHFITDRKPWKNEYCLFYTKEYYQYLKPFLSPEERRAYWAAKPMGLIKLISRKH